MVNDDTVLHNVHGLLGQRTLWNLALPLKGHTIRKWLAARPGLLEMKCDGHAGKLHAGDLA